MELRHDRIHVGRRDVAHDHLLLGREADAAFSVPFGQVGDAAQLVTGDATGVVLSDPLPAGSGSGVTWTIDPGVGTPAQFVLSGAKGAQTQCDRGTWLCPSDIWRAVGSGQRCSLQVAKPRCGSK